MSVGDVEWMGRALRLAEAAVGLAAPNPVVGCCLVRDGVVLGEGAHVYEARDHAEIVALKQAAANGMDVRGAVAYVTLEPCSHHGRTGPCADALIAAGIGRCVVATVDPNPAVSGRGIARLEAAGMEVVVGVLEQEARALNDGFARWIQAGVPLVVLKVGLSVDGMVAPAASARVGREPVWLTGPEAREDVQRLRHGVDAILVGVGTVLADDPALTDRTGLARRRRLLRVVLDAGLRTPVDSRLVKSVEGDLLVLCGVGASFEKILALEEMGVSVVRVADVGGRLVLQAVLGELGARGLLSVLVEGGSAVHGAFLREGLVDKVVLYYAETELGVGGVAFADGVVSSFALQERMMGLEMRPVGVDVRVTGRLRDVWVEGEKDRSRSSRFAEG